MINYYLQTFLWLLSTFIMDYTWVKKKCTDTAWKNALNNNICKLAKFESKWMVHLQSQSILSFLVDCTKW